MDAKDKRIAELEGLLKEALEEIERLKAEIAALKKNSTNSSKPPSSDIVKPPKPRKDKERRRKIGAQKGHKQHLRNPAINRVRMALIDDETRRVVARETVDFLFFTEDTVFDWVEKFVESKRQQGVLF